MTPRERLNLINLIKKMESNPEYTKKLKLKNNSSFKTKE